MQIPVGYKEVPPIITQRPAAENDARKATVTSRFFSLFHLIWNLVAKMLVLKMWIRNNNYPSNQSCSLRHWTVDDSSSQDVIFDLPSLVEKQNHVFMTLPYIYQSTHSISFPLSALTHSISLPCKINGKEGQSVDANFWHLVESISHQHWCPNS